MSAQESIITGLENIHISKGATIITEHTEAQYQNLGTRQKVAQYQNLGTRQKVWII